MIALLGGSGYVGQAFERELTHRGWAFQTLTRSVVDYSSFEIFYQWLKEHRPSFVVNAAGYTGKPNVDACELAKADTLIGNTLLPQTLAHVCAAASVPWGHVSSGCIYSGARVIQAGSQRVEKDLTTDEMRNLLSRDRNVFRGFTEEDVPNFSFRDGPTSFYSGTKALAEERIVGVGSNYIWRLRIPFDEFDNARNYLSKVQRYSKVYDNVNSVSHREDFVKACLDLWKLRAPFGVYNVTNPGFVTTREVTRWIESKLSPPKAFEFWASDEEFYRVAAKTPRSNCILDSGKLLKTGVKIRTVEEAMADSLSRWRPERKS